jgi:hypothetical protein
MKTHGYALGIIWFVCVAMVQTTRKNNDYFKPFRGKNIVKVPSWIFQTLFFLLQVKEGHFY